MRCGRIVRWGTGPRKNSQRAVQLSGRLRLPASCTAEKNKSKTNPRNSHYDWTKEWGQANGELRDHLDNGRAEDPAEGEAG